MGIVETVGGPAVGRGSAGKAGGSGKVGWLSSGVLYGPSPTAVLPATEMR